VSGGAVGPEIICSWVLADMQPGTTSGGIPDSAVQYSDRSDAHQHDDDMGVIADADNSIATGTQTPCTGPPRASVTQVDGVRQLVQVRPNPEDTPGPRQVQLWMASNSGRTTAAVGAPYWKVFLPDGSLKVQITGNAVPQSDCPKLGNATSAGTMFEAAVHTGQVSAAAVDDATFGLLAVCQKQGGVYSGLLPLSYKDPCGAYRVEAHLPGAGAVEDVLTAYLDVLCVTYLRIDFNSLDWGKVTPGKSVNISGDLDWRPPSDAAPTVRNGGNAGMGLALQFAPMVLLDAAGRPVANGTPIDAFNTCFGRGPQVAQCFAGIKAGAIAAFDSSRERVLCAGEAGKLDLAINPPTVIPAGQYRGSVSLIARNVEGVCTGERVSTSP
jgi:hypothetical protein